MVKKILMLPLMAFALVTLTAATVTEDGEDVFEWEILDETTALPSETADIEESYTAGDDELETYIYYNQEKIDVYISSKTELDAYLYYNYDEKYTEYSENRVDLETDYSINTNDDSYIHIEISNKTKSGLSFLGGFNNRSNMNEQAPDITTLETTTPPITVFEEISGALISIVTAGSSVFVSAFDGLLDVFWDADANDGDGALNWIAYVAVLPVGFYLVRWGIRQILRIMQQRL